MTLHRAIARVRQTEGVKHVGQISGVMPTWINANGPNVPVGSLCKIGGDGTKSVLAEVVRLDATGIALLPYGETSTLAVGSRVEALNASNRLPVGNAFLGRAIDALGLPIDGEGQIDADTFSFVNAAPPAPLERETPVEIMETGIRTIDGLLTLGRGQRIGVFAASGVGKTSLLSQLIRQVDADICIACLVGERGREVEAIWANDLAGEVRKRSVIVAATSDQAAALRVRAVQQAVALARYWRDAGRNVFFVLDSATRLAMALREVGLAAGEPPTVRAYTPNVFAQIPRIIEQFGALKTGGSITAVLTVLAENDDVDDPLCELLKSLLDGHIVLSRTMAEKGLFPAIDPLKSVSRNAGRLMSQAHLEAARKAQALLARYESSRTMIDAGLYSPSSNEDIDAAIATKPMLERFMAQSLRHRENLSETRQALQQLVEDVRAGA